MVHSASDSANLLQQLEQLQSSEAKFRQIAENVREVFFVFSPGAEDVLYISPAYEEVWGRSCESLYAEPNSWMSAIHQEDIPLALGTLQTGFWTAQEFFEEYRIIRPDESVRWVSVRAFPVTDDRGEFIRFVGIAEDVTQRKRAEQALVKSENQFRSIFESAPIGMVITNLEGIFEQVNPAFCELLGYSWAKLRGSSFQDILVGNSLITYKTSQKSLQQGLCSDFQLEQTYLNSAGELVEVILKTALIRDSNQQPLHLNHQIIDLTDQRESQRQLFNKSFHDALTGVANRFLFIACLEQEIKRKRLAPEHQFGLLLLNLDRFKIVNDSMGHIAGDYFLTQIAERLKKCVRGSDTLARLGGDEFAFLISGIQENSSVVMAVADRIIEHFKEPIIYQNREYYFSFGMGIVIPGFDSLRAEQVMSDATITMRSAKRRCIQGSCYEIFAPSLRNKAKQRFLIESDLRVALTSKLHELEVYYQPIICLGTNKIAGFEALARWQHQKKGFIPPDKFIPIAEETGLIISLGEWLLSEACKQTKLWQDAYQADLAISVNFSAKQLYQPNLVQRIEHCLTQVNLSPSSLKLEITESVMLEDLEHLIKVLSALRDQGIQISLDDFGTGYSSLSYLHQFPVDILKIDRSFVGQSADSGQAIIKTIISLAKALDLEVIAEGLEDESQVSYLESLDCDYAQGYYYAKPLSVAEVEKYLAGN